MKEGLNEIVCIIDRSGSMGAIKDDAIGGFNEFIEGQKKLPGTAFATYIQFDDEYEVVYENRPIQAVEPIDSSTYSPRGMTALYDAVGKTIIRVGERLKNTPDEERPEKVIVVILTDGQENSSREISAETVKEMITHQQDKYNWEFIFLAANQDAFETAATIGVKLDNTAGFAHTGDGVRGAYDYASNVTTSYRTSSDNRP